MTPRVALRAVLVGACLAATHGTARAQDEPPTPQMVTPPALVPPFDADILDRIRQAILASGQVTQNSTNNE